MGLGFARLSVTDKRVTLIERLKIQGKILQAVFCFYLNGQNTRNGGLLIIGGCDDEAEIYIPLSKPGYWEFILESLIMSHDDDGNSVICNHCSGILDTGTSLIIGPDEYIDRINRKIGGTKNRKTGEYRISCSASKLPKIVFQFTADYSVILYPKDYILKVHTVDENFIFCEKKNV